MKNKKRTTGNNTNWQEVLRCGVKSIVIKPLEDGYSFFVEIKTRDNLDILKKVKDNELINIIRVVAIEDSECL